MGMGTVSEFVIVMVLVWMRVCGTWWSYKHAPVYLRAALWL